MAAMDYETLKKEGKLADPKMGMQLRMAMSSGMKVSYKNLMSAEAPCKTRTRPCSSSRLTGAPAARQTSRTSMLMAPS